MWPLDKIDRLRPLHYLALALICLAFFLPGQASLPPTDRDESRFVQASKQMIESGNYTDIYFQNENRYKKPIGIYWLQSASLKLTGAPLNEIWAYRLPSMLAAVASVLLTVAIGARLFNPAVGLMAGMLLASSLLMNIEARLAKTDATLLVTILATHYALISLWIKRAADKFHAALFWVALAVGVLIKGPIIFIPVLPVLIWLCRRDRVLLKNLCPKWGVPLFFLIVLPWFVAITLKGGAAFWQASAGHDLIGKVKGGQESHGMPPGYYAVLFFATFWPGCLPAFLALPYLKQNWRQEKVALLLLWIVPTWLLFELVPTKLPHYVLPAYPAIALLTALALQVGFKPFRYKIFPLMAWGIWIVVTLGLALGFAALPLVAGQVALWQMLSATAVTGLLVWFCRNHARLPTWKFTASHALLAALFMLPLFGLTLPGFKHIWISEQVQDAITAEGCIDSHLISARFNEPSLVFLNGTDTVLNATGEKAADWLAQYPASENPACRFALVGRDHWQRFIDRLDAQPLDIERVADIRGFSYSTGRSVDMQLVRRAIPRERLAIP